MLFFLSFLSELRAKGPPVASKDMLLPFLKRFGKAAIAIELSAAAGLYYIFHEINTGGPEVRARWDKRVPFLIDAFYKATGDQRVIEHRNKHINNSNHIEESSKQ